MKKIVVALSLISLFSCGEKEIQLPQLNETVVTDVKNHSPVYMFFETNGNDTLIDVNRSNSISSTNWLFNIDKRLPLKLVIPEIQKLQAKKEKSSHKKEGSGNYFTYMDSKKKTLAFLTFTNLEFVIEKPVANKVLFFSKNGKIFLNGIELNENLEEYLENIQVEELYDLVIGFDKNASFETFVKGNSILQKAEVKRTFIKQFVY